MCVCGGVGGGVAEEGDVFKILLIVAIKVLFL